MELRATKGLRQFSFSLFAFPLLAFSQPLHSLVSHVPVLLNEVLAVLEPKAGETYADCTAGLGGHACAVAKRMGHGTIVLNDVDPANLERAAGAVRGAWKTDQGPEGLGTHGLEAHATVVVRGNFAELPHVLRERGICANMILADLGFASNQIEDASRGFSFQRDGPLDMRLDPTLPMHAGHLVNSAPEAELVRILTEYGEESGARRIARKLVDVRSMKPIATTSELAGAVHAALGFSGGPIDPATRTFQAIRIAVNDELGSLEGLLGLVEQACGELAAGRATWLAKGARVAIISFHSLEDRLVKQAFGRIGKQYAKQGAKEVTKHPVTASEAELGWNPRARSAKLRCVRVCG
jgi:16S rRNA (cytosine1402-N4)-methyltransferase